MNVQVLRQQKTGRGLGGGGEWAPVEVSFSRYPNQRSAFLPQPPQQPTTANPPQPGTAPLQPPAALEPQGGDGRCEGHPVNTLPSDAAFVGLRGGEPAAPTPPTPLPHHHVPKTPASAVWKARQARQAQRCTEAHTTGRDTQCSVGLFARARAVTLTAPA